MIPNGGGSIILIASMSASVSTSVLSPYHKYVLTNVSQIVNIPQVTIHIPASPGFTPISYYVELASDTI